MSDTDIVAGDSKAFKDLLSFFAFEFFFCTMDPTASDSKIMCGKHQISHRQASVIDSSRTGCICQYDQYNRCSVKWIKAFLPAADHTVHLHDLIPHLFICYRNNDRRLQASAICSKCSCFNDLIQNIRRNHIRFELPDTSSRLHLIQNNAHLKILLITSTGTIH